MKIKIDKKQAEKVFKARLPLFAPALILGMFGGIGWVVFVYAEHLSFFYKMTVMIPTASIVGLSLLFILKRRQQEAHMGVIEFDEEKLSRSVQDGETTSIEIEKLGSVSDGFFEVVVKGDVKTI